jgi:hypothetical protein
MMHDDKYCIIANENKSIHTSTPSSLCILYRLPVMQKEERECLVTFEPVNNKMLCDWELKAMSHWKTCDFSLLGIPRQFMIL